MLTAAERSSSSALLPPHVQRAAARVTAATRDKDGPTLNVCLSYTARQELEAATQAMVAGVQAGKLQPADIDPDLLARCLYTEPETGACRKALEDSSLQPGAFCSVLF
eukprot:SAG22_NODE_5928_length_929_cov_1.332530_2_plen_108_part_00